jgi:lipopolysaccharide export system ATP-binding protein
MATLRTERLTKAFGGRTVVRAVDLEVASGEVVGLLGPNGAGKTTTFGMVVGLVGPDSGRVLLDDEDVTDDPMYVRARKGIGYLPQEPSIFRGLTVEQNVLAILETLPLSASERRARLTVLLEELGLTGLARSKAYTLSGGERCWTSLLELRKSFLYGPVASALGDGVLERSDSVPFAGRVRGSL